LLRSHIAGGAQIRARIRCVAFNQTFEREICQQHLIIIAQQHVFRFEVSMQNIPGVGIGKSLPQMHDHAHSMLKLKWQSGEAAA